MKTEKREPEQYVDLGHSELENHLKTQVALYEKRLKEGTAANKVAAFFATNLFGFAYHYLKSRFGPKAEYQFYPRNGDDGIYPMHTYSDAVTLALVSDWATDTPESDRIGYLIRDYDPDYTIHLGDVYFVGTPEEIATNFTDPDASWHFGKHGSLALSGNHEMYSNGTAFFKKLLPAMKIRKGDQVATQQAGFFCLENSHWRIIGLDTGYNSTNRPLLEVLFKPDCNLRDEHLKWLTEVVKLNDPNDKRGIIFLSHHPYFSSFRDDHPVVGRQLKKAFGAAERPVLWFWGHEHRLSFYNKYGFSDGIQAWGRCVGHGGMPVETNPPDRGHTGQLLFYDQRIRERIRRRDVGYNGFALLSVQGAAIDIKYIDQNNHTVIAERWTVDEAGSLSMELLELHPEVTKY
ncbi:calcineurin-like phosphoesterase family protein [Larkinella arboricola]|uniref:Calcineurin-like phosphoesterase family protein n=1 Tax=Larkinella arboricola TaxID=643671 RepID=A0A327X1I0_LARAB|nr:metallophosphoesterase [Larkinella arboricola]RAJ99969.1 calcineurin-like phosphoesterase family protein [Larkinella arboricola]